MLPEVLPFAGKTYVAGHDGHRLTDQALRVYEAMTDGVWRTLGEISAITDAPEASVSARLRDLRKPEFGAYVVNRQRRGLASAGLWEYQLLPPREVESRPSMAAAKKSGFLKGLMYAAQLAAKADDLNQLKAQLRAELVKAYKR